MTRASSRRELRPKIATSPIRALQLDRRGRLEVDALQFKSIGRDAAVHTHVITSMLLALLASTASLMSNDAARMASIRRAARDGECLTDLEELHLTRVGGEMAATYGEITPAGMTSLAERLKLTKDDSFIDLGSGLGRAVIQAVTDYDVRKSIGVELANSRHTLALKTLGKADESVRERVQLIKGDCADEKLWREQLSGTTVAFVASLLFDKTLMARLATCLEECSSLRAVASLKKWGDDEMKGFKEAESVLCEMSWNAELAVVNGRENVEKHPGTVVYVYERVG